MFLGILFQGDMMMYPSSASSSSANSASVRVEKATSEFLNGPDWTINIDICDAINLNHWFLLYPYCPFFFLYLCEFCYWLWKKYKQEDEKFTFLYMGFDFWFVCVDVMNCMCVCMHVLIWVFDYLVLGSWWWEKIESFGVLGFCE